MVMIEPVQNAKCVLFPETKLNCLTWVKKQLKVMLKAKNIDRLALYIQSSHIKFTAVSKGSAESPCAFSRSTCSSTSAGSSQRC